MSRPKGYNYEGICERCGKKYIKAYRRPHQRFCGSAKMRTGCSYANQLTLSKKWAKKNPDKSRNFQNDCYHRKHPNAGIRGAYKIKCQN